MTVGYAINQWKPGSAQFVRTEEHARAFKTIAATGFGAVELRAGTFRWEPLGRPERIAQYYGSVEEFIAVLHACGVPRVSSYFLDPEEPILEEASYGRDPANPGDRDGIVASTRPFLKFLQQAGGSTLVVRPARSYWRTGRLDGQQVRELAATWNAVGAAAAEFDISVGLHIDCLSAIQTADEIARLLELTDKPVGLAIDTAELTIAGLDPVQIFKRHADRVTHVHLKSARATDTLGERTMENAEAAFLRGGGRRGIDRWFWEPGADGGLVDFPALFHAFADSGYGGTIVVETDQSPDPAGSAMLSGWYLHKYAAPMFRDGPLAA